MWTCVLVLAGFPSSDAGTGDASSKSLLGSSCSSSLWPRLDLVYGVVGLAAYTKKGQYLKISDATDSNKQRKHHIIVKCLCVCALRHAWSPTLSWCSSSCSPGVEGWGRATVSASSSWHCRASCPASRRVLSPHLSGSWQRSSSS